MQVFFKQNLAILAVPKTGTTAYETALKGKADIVFKGRRKHMSAAAFDQHCAPFLQATYKLTPERVAVMREPLDHLRSWFKYRTRDVLKGDKRSTFGMSFEDYVQIAIDAPTTPCANVGTQFKFLSLRGGEIPLHHVFAYEAQPVFLDFLEERFKREITLPEINKSPQIDTPLSDDLKAAFKAARRKDYALYERVQEAGGHLELEYG
ncbi:hypothetical protein KO498_16360 [Lentibacter algarum]|uniref:hypothetical protein n=1 Tax=Lentibacter algarum TaxID=576131 RepID=UPI001C095121|nr:hypothetical protein [Lentibacter algarum]MBU2983380.1 hypothetical protein [Lentibacter algarum]